MISNIVNVLSVFYTMHMSDLLKKEIHAFEQMKPTLLKHHMGKFVIIHDEKLVGAYDTFDAAAKEAIKQFGKGPYLIREVGSEPSKNLPASVAYRIVHASN